MGNVQNQELRSKQTLVQKSMMQSFTRSTQSMSQHCKIAQELKITVGPTGKITGGIATKQGAQLICSLQGDATSKLTNDMNNDVQAELQSLSSQGSKSFQDFLSTSISSQNQKISVKNFVEQTFSAVIENISETSCAQNLDLSQTQEVIILGQVDSLDLEQQAQASAVAACIMNNAVDTLTSNKDFAKAVSELDQTSESEQQGLTSLVSAWGNIIIGVVALLVVLGLLALGVWWFMTKKPKTEVPPIGPVQLQPRILT